MWSAYADHIPSNFLKTVFYKIYLVHSWLLCPKYDYRLTSNLQYRKLSILTVTLTEAPKSNKGQCYDRVVPIDTRCRFYVDTTTHDIARRRIDVETTSCVYHGNKSTDLLCKEWLKKTFTRFQKTARKFLTKPLQYFALAPRWCSFNVLIFHFTKARSSDKIQEYHIKACCTKTDSSWNKVLFFLLKVLFKCF